jgi:hypothetical protein
MYIYLDEGRVTNAAEAMDLPGLDDKNVTSAGFEFLSVDGPKTATFPHELDFIVWMTMGSGTTTREGAEEEHGDIYVAVIGPNEVVRASLKWQVLLADAVHHLSSLWGRTLSHSLAIEGSRRPPKDDRRDP